jgi:O-antigen/teichoic acid export membrane protein
MANESRVKKSLLNARVSIFYYMLVLIISFFSRKVFLDTLGVDFIGLTGTLQNLLQFLNLAELGIGMAISGVLYKPLFDNDQTKINEVISVFGYLYNRIGYVIIIAGCILGAFLPLIYSNTGFDYPIIIFAYFSFLFSSLIGYFVNYKQILLGADQRNYVVVACFQSVNIIRTLIQMGCAYYTGNYYLWISLEIFFGIVNAIILNRQINKIYPWLRPEIKQGKILLKKYPDIIKYTKQLFIQKISYVVQYQTVPLLTFAFVSLKVVTFYGNYTIITDKIGQFINTFLESTGAGVGNLIASGDKNRIKRVFWELLSLRYFIGGVITFAIYTCTKPFIVLWLGKEYVLSEYILILICLNLLIGYTRGGVMQFLSGYRLFSDVWAPIAEIIINITIACIGGSYYGLSGVLSGGIVSQIIIVCIWKPYFLYSRAFKDSIWTYWGNILVIIAVIIFPMLLVTFFRDYMIGDIIIDSYLKWIIFSIVNISIYGIIAFISMTLVSQGMRDSIGRIISKYKKKI